METDRHLKSYDSQTQRFDTCLASLSGDQLLWQASFCINKLASFTSNEMKGSRERGRSWRARPLNKASDGNADLRWFLIIPSNWMVG